MKYILREETLSTLIYVFYAYIVISKCFLKYRHKLNPQGLRGTIFGRGENMIKNLNGCNVPFEYPV